MNYSDLKNELASTCGTTQADVDRILDGLREHIHEELAAGNDVALPGLGKFTTSQRAARKGRNPQTGAEIDIAASTVARFKPAKALKDAVNH